MGGFGGCIFLSVVTPPSGNFRMLLRELCREIKGTERRNFKALEFRESGSLNGAPLPVEVRTLAFDERPRAKYVPRPKNPKKQKGLPSHSSTAPPHLKADNFVFPVTRMNAQPHVYHGGRFIPSSQLPKCCFHRRYNWFLANTSMTCGKI